jgi:hypothetical protein
MRERRHSSVSLHPFHVRTMMYVRGNSKFFLLPTVRARVVNQTDPGFLAIQRTPLQAIQRDIEFIARAAAFPRGFKT